MNSRCEYCSAPLSAEPARSRGCPKCKAAVYAVGQGGGEVRLQVISEKGGAAAAFRLDRLQSLTLKKLNPEDFLSIEILRCPFCSHDIALGNIGDLTFDGARFRLLLPQKRTGEVRCAHCNQVNHVLDSAAEPFVVEFRPMKRDSFEAQVDQFVNQPPPHSAPQRAGCLGLLIVPFLNR